MNFLRIRSTPNGKEIDWVEVYDCFDFCTNPDDPEDEDFVDIETVHFERENEQEIIDTFILEDYNE